MGLPVEADGLVRLYTPDGRLVGYVNSVREDAGWLRLEVELLGLVKRDPAEH